MAARGYAAAPAPMPAAPRDVDRGTGPLRADRERHTLSAPSGFRTRISARAGCNAELLLDFLKSTECETLVSWSATSSTAGSCSKGWYWPPRHNDIVRCVLKKAKHGTRVIYVPGNHDEAVPRLCRAQLRRDRAGRRSASTMTADGRGCWCSTATSSTASCSTPSGSPSLATMPTPCCSSSTAVLNCGPAQARAALLVAVGASLKKKVKNAVQFISQLRGGGRPCRRRARRRRRGLRAHPLAPRCARSARSPIIMTATGSRAAPRWSSMPTGGWRSSTGPSASEPRPRSARRERRDAAVAGVKIALATRRLAPAGQRRRPLAGDDRRAAARARATTSR